MIENIKKNFHAKDINSFDTFKRLHTVYSIYYSDSIELEDNFEVLKLLNDSYEPIRYWTLMILSRMPRNSQLLHITQNIDNLASLADDSERIAVLARKLLEKSITISECKNCKNNEDSEL